MQSGQRLCERLLAPKGVFQAADRLCVHKTLFCEKTCILFSQTLNKTYCLPLPFVNGVLQLFSNYPYFPTRIQGQIVPFLRGESKKRSDHRQNAKKQTGQKILVHFAASACIMHKAVV